ncbi:hypothetical protein TRFO_08190 [Tritrichomonas foetus]|uniref:E2F/DP family winged-helix DNA-binding domain-containing protein n=1 Tax=Tritrichomonas foetus TaxID=1144522 RepID=A0A1J4JQU0_9EUKA|nr:hypothetical protein TRFO_08190 [Tritrichomonas foetus]|eukprot:OHS99885.1 hypothetical protein TRFO_08190 [Tritrichomonas foetus]
MTHAKSSLKDLTKIIFDKLSERKQITIKDFTSYIMSQYSISIPEPSFRRRIYDVISVFTCLGYAEKNEGNLTWLGKPSHSPKPPSYDQIHKRVLSKEEVLKHKARMLLLYKALEIENSNFHQINDQKAYIPFIYVECPTDSITIEQNNTNTLKMSSSKDMIFLSPSELLEKKTFHVSTIYQALNECPELSQCKELLNIDFSNKKGDDMVYI